MQIVDADGHVAEGASLAVQAMERWPQHIKLRTDGRPSLLIEGRHYPEDQGPGAGCPPEHGLSSVAGINWSSPEGVLKDADRDHIDTMVLYPSFGLCAPSLEDPEFAARLRPPLQPVDRRLLPLEPRAAARRGGDADRARPRRDRHHARGEGRSAWWRRCCRRR